ncbi:MAG TPA: ATP-dependent DNA ligase [Solirubrobacteraceae bacterium]|nr:ATP-dependent DNA ligase [Solirubrobacteraceae bacterium]
MLLRDLVETSEAVGATRARGAKVEAIAALLARAAPGEIRATVAFLSGELLQRQIGVGHALLRDVPGPAAAPSLTVAEVDAAFAAIGALSGAGSQGARRNALHGLLARADAGEQRFLVRLLAGDLRQGALAGIMAEAVARAAGLPAADVRRALMLRGDLPAVAELALTDGAEGLAALRLQVGRPLAPMLAGTAEDLDAALARAGPALVEWKLDGARVQIHRDGDDVAVFTRTLDEVTARVPEVVDAALALPARAAVLDGEAIALDPQGRPRPFQVTASRFGSRRDVEGQRAAIPLTPFLFDLLHLDGEDLLDHPLRERTEALDRLAPAGLRPGRAASDEPAAARAVLDDALARGHEGVMVKALGSRYAAGRRGGDWLKVKPVHTLDLVVLAAEWGHGRRHGWLSNLHLGARDPATGGWAMLGKTFKGLTDALLTWQTERLLALETHRDRWTVYVRPELVVEIAFDGVQRSSRYASGLALRFARVRRYRDDKPAAEADTVELVRALLPRDG